MLLLLLACATSEPSAPAPSPDPAATEPVSDPVLVLDPPIAGQAGIDWAVQNHVDVDPGPGDRDSFGGRKTYDGHKGTDFRIHGLPAMVQGVEVLAPAAGRVLRTRDGEADRCGSGDRALVPSDMACGNGMVIDHGGGFQTQLCHLRKGSVQVQDGQEVEAGEVLGLVGWSGKADFPHVHITVRHDGELLDPFAPPAVGPRAEWHAPEQVPPAAHRVWATGFWGSAVGQEDLLLNPEGATRIADDADAIVAYGFALSNEDPPAWLLEARSPSGRVFRSADPPKGRAQGMVYVGKKRMEGERLEQGTWTARLQVGEEALIEWSVEVVAGPVEEEPVTWEGCAGGG